MWPLVAYLGVASATTTVPAAWCGGSGSASWQGCQYPAYVNSLTLYVGGTPLGIIANCTDGSSVTALSLVGALNQITIISKPFGFLPSDVKVKCGSNWQGVAGLGSTPQASQFTTDSYLLNGFYFYEPLQILGLIPPSIRFTYMPLTVAPTMSPTTRTPTTSAPTTSPTTNQPTTAPTAPTTWSPTTSPITWSPTTSPTTSAPTTYSPTTSSPTTSAPTTRAPTINEALSQSPVNVSAVPGPLPGQGQAVVVVTLSGAGVGSLRGSNLTHILSEIFTQLNITNPGGVTVTPVPGKDGSPGNGLVVSIVVSQGVGSAVNQREQAMSLNLGPGISSSVQVQWPSVLQLFENLTWTQLWIFLGCVFFFIFMVVSLHLRVNDKRHIVPFLTFIMAIIASIINVWLLTTLSYAAKVDRESYMPFYVAFIILVIAPPLTNMASLRLFLHRILSGDPDFRQWVQMTRLRMVLIYAMSIFGVSNVAILESKAWGQCSNAPMKPQTSAYFNALGVVGTFLEGCRLTVQIVMAIMHREASLAVAIPIVASGVVTFLGVMQRLYNVGYIRSSGQRKHIDHTDLLQLH